MIIRMQDVRSSKMCVIGARRFFRRYDLDWKKFITIGIDEIELINTGDAMAIRVVEEAHARRK